MFGKKNKVIARSTVGTDPEFFMVNEGGKFVSAVGHVPGSKNNPHMMNSGAGLQTDNVAVEFASIVAGDGEELVKSLKETLGEIRALLPAKHDIAAIPSAEFPDEELQTEQAKAFGCSPDYNAWEMVENEVGESASQNFRSCGGHLHVGHNPGDGNEAILDFGGKMELVKLMDCLNGITSTILDDSPEAIERRKLYGSAGCHRPTEYGIEYRVLSNFWLKSPQLVMLQDSLIQDCLAIMRAGKADEVIAEIGGDRVVSTINDGNVDEAHKIVTNHLQKHMSKDSKGYFKECVANIKSYDLKTSWA